MRGARAVALFFAVLVGAAGCGHSRWPAKVLGDGTSINTTPIDASVDRLRAMPRPAGVDSLGAPRVPAERQVYRVHALLLRFTLARDGDIHLAIADPGHPANTMIAEIPDPSRMTGAPNIYRVAVARARREFIAAFGTPVMSTWKPAHQEVILIGPLFFDLLHGQAGGLFGGTPTGIEIHPVLLIDMGILKAPKARDRSLLSALQTGRVDEIASQALREYGIPGMSVAVVKNGRLAYARGYGFSNAGARTPATARTQYQIGSITKQFTAAIILQLAAEHRLSLDDTVVKYFPFFRRASTVTIRDLLDQRSGITDYNSAWMLWAAAPALFARVTDREGVVRAVAGRDLGFRPGLAFQYSNSNYLLLGLIAERVTGRPLPELMASRLFSPLGMRRSLLGMARYCDDETACGYSKTPFGIWAIKPWKSDWTYSAGGMTSTALDLAKWDVALMSGRVLPATAFASMSVPHTGSQYGYGLFIYNIGAHKIVWHDGTVYGFRAMNSMILPDRDAVVVLCNADYAHAVITAMRIESAIFSVSGGEGEHWDPGLPRYTYPMAFGFAFLPVLALLVFRRRWFVGTLIAILSYATGVYLWPVGLACGIAGAIVVAVRRR